MAPRRNTVSYGREITLLTGRGSDSRFYFSFHQPKKTCHCFKNSILQKYLIFRKRIIEKIICHARNLNTSKNDIVPFL